MLYTLISYGSALSVNKSTRPYGSSSQHVAAEDPWEARLVSHKRIILGSRLNILLIFAPLSFISHHLDWDAALRFSFSCVAIIPLAKLSGDATQQLSTKLGKISANVSRAAFGNTVEIILGITALLQDEFRIIQTLMLGSILRNILLAPGCSFIAVGIKSKEVSFQATGAQASASLLSLACITLVIPAAYRSARHGMLDLDPSAETGLLIISRGTAVLLLGVYVLFLIFQLKTHAFLFTSYDEAEEETETNIAAWAIVLLVAVVLTLFCANYLIASVDEATERYDIPKSFVGLILLPFLVNVAEQVSAVSMASECKMELVVSACVGRSIQIAALVIPLLVIIGWTTGTSFTLYLSNIEAVVFSASVLLVNTLIRDGKSYYFDGIMLVTLYLVIALSFWVI